MLGAREAGDRVSASRRRAGDGQWALRWGDRSGELRRAAADSGQDWLAALFVIWALVVLLAPGAGAVLVIRLLVTGALLALAWRAWRMGITFAAHELVVHDLLSTWRRPYGDVLGFEARVVPFLLVRVVMHMADGKPRSVWSLAAEASPNQAQVLSAGERVEELNEELRRRRGGALAQPDDAGAGEEVLDAELVEDTGPAGLGRDYPGPRPPGPVLDQ
jgi:hypothetical protein